MCSCYSSREEQYKQLWSELEAFLRAHCVTDKHINILNCLLEVRNKDSSPDLGDKVELDQALRELDQYVRIFMYILFFNLISSNNLLLYLFSRLSSKSSERVSVIRATTDSPLSPDPVPHSLQNKTLLEVWVSKFCRTKPRPEFAGLSHMQTTSEGKLVAKLYPHLKERTKNIAKPRIME